MAQHHRPQVTCSRINFDEPFLTSVHPSIHPSIFGMDLRGSEHCNLIIGALEGSPPSAVQSSWEETLYSSRRLCLVCKSAVNLSPAGPSSRQEPRVPGALIRSASRQGWNKKNNLLNRASEPQPAAIKVLLCWGERTPRPPEGQQEIQLPACHMSSAGVILGNKTDLSHLCTGCRDPKAIAGERKEKNTAGAGKLNFCFIAVAKNYRLGRKTYPGEKMVSLHVKTSLTVKL